MTLQIVITSVIVISAVYILYKNIKNKATGKCDCGSCSSHCSSYKKDSSQK
ncbi:FeoB-associated Cys-rich membrane protein [Clostridium lundense]|uniref:FeoB-associated Cys-rich membrane protein n=1 Tax=Clostridium lundense TaxID=319475 RepID=UPI0009FCD048|nr:FeoB-associated Cys-rich membrane protein [Clostridium lundense]